MGLSIDREKVVERIHEAIDMGVCVDLFIDVLNLLKEQEPMKPTWSNGKAYCGNCGQRLPRKCDGIERRYCSFCGKKVKWDD